MARVTVEDCLENVDNRFQLVLVATKRARQIAAGADTFVDVEKDKPTVVALREIAEGHVTRDILKEVPKEEVLEFVETEEESEDVAESEVDADILAALTAEFDATTSVDAIEKVEAADEKPAETVEEA